MQRNVRISDYRSDDGAYEIRVLYVSATFYSQHSHRRFFTDTKSRISPWNECEIVGISRDRNPLIQMSISELKNCSAIRCKQEISLLPRKFAAQISSFSSRPEIELTPHSGLLREEYLFISALLDSGEHSWTCENLKYFWPPP